MMFRNSKIKKETKREEALKEQVSPQVSSEAIESPFQSAAQAEMVEKATQEIKVTNFEDVNIQIVEEENQNANYIIENEEEDKDGGNPIATVDASKSENSQGQSGAIPNQNSPVLLNIGQFDEERVKNAIKMKPRSLSFVFNFDEEQKKTDDDTSDVKSCSEGSTKSERVVQRPSLEFSDNRQNSESNQVDDLDKLDITKPE